VYVGLFTEPLPGNALIKSVTILKHLLIKYCSKRGMESLGSGWGLTAGKPCCHVLARDMSSSWADVNVPTKTTELEVNALAVFEMGLYLCSTNFIYWRIRMCPLNCCRNSVVSWKRVLSPNLTFQRKERTLLHVYEIMYFDQYFICHWMELLWFSAISHFAPDYFSKQNFMMQCSFFEQDLT
jgi:hypothetical protein